MRPTCEEIRRSFKAILKSLRPIMLKSIEVQKLTEKLSNLKFPNGGCGITPLVSTPPNSQLNISTPNAIGEEMSKLDPYYMPSATQNINPFLPLFGNRQIIGNCLSCFEFNAAEKIQQEQYKKPTYRKTVSMVGHHPSNLENYVNN